MCTIFDDGHIVREIYGAPPNLFRFNPINNSRWDIINADFTTPFWSSIKAQTEAGLSFKRPAILLSLKNGIFYSKAYSKPNFRKIAGPNCGPVGARQGYMVISDNTPIRPHCAP